MSIGKNYIHYPTYHYSTVNTLSNYTLYMPIDGWFNVLINIYLHETKNQRQISIFKTFDVFMLSYFSQYFIYQNDTHIIET